MVEIRSLPMAVRKSAAIGLVMLALSAAGLAVAARTLHVRCRGQFEISSSTRLGDTSSSAGHSLVEEYNAIDPRNPLGAPAGPLAFVDLTWRSVGRAFAGCDLQVVIDAPGEWRWAGWTSSSNVTAGSTPILGAGMSKVTTRVADPLTLSAPPSAQGFVRTVWVIPSSLGAAASGPIRSYLFYGCVGAFCDVAVAKGPELFV